MEVDCIAHKSSGYFSPLITDYLEEPGLLAPFFKYTPNDEGLTEAIADRQRYKVDRDLLVTALKNQYQGLEVHEKVSENIAALAQPNTFTICTAHQPNLMTGYLYFIYKIVQAAKLADHLQQQHKDKKFVPVFYMGSEDNDLEELGVFRFRQQKFRWITDQSGAVGRMHTKDLKDLLQELYKLIGPPGANADYLLQLIQESFEQQETIAAATRYLVNALLGKFGVLVLDPDDQALKKTFISVMKDELLQGKSYDLVKEPSQTLNQKYKAQAFARKINLFYLKDDFRERIERTEEGYQALHSSFRWSEEEILAELEKHPENFSPNVILRGLFQETILPNVAFVGGGSEVAYWMQLLPLFQHYGVFFPPLVLRQSILWMPKTSQDLQLKTNCSNVDLFLSADQLAQNFVQHNTHKDLQLEDIQLQLQQLLQQIKAKATAIDTTLNASVEAALSKMRHQIAVIEKKMIRAEKRNMGTQLAQLYKLKSLLFPNNSLQERQENFLEYYLEYGAAYFDDLYAASLPYGNRFVIIKA